MRRLPCVYSLTLFLFPIYCHFTFFYWFLRSFVCLAWIFEVTHCIVGYFIHVLWLFYFYSSLESPWLLETWFNLWFILPYNGFKIWLVLILDYFRYFYPFSSSLMNHEMRFNLILNFLFLFCFSLLEFLFFLTFY